MTTITIELDNTKELGENIRSGEQDDFLVLIIDKRKELGMSSTQKSMAIASTSGMIRLPENRMLNVWYGRKM